jgi:hypothetical protein
VVREAGLDYRFNLIKFEEFYASFYRRSSGLQVDFA